MITWHARVYNLRKYRPTTAYCIKLGKSGTRRSPGAALRSSHAIGFADPRPGAHSPGIRHLRGNGGEQDAAGRFHPGQRWGLGHG